MKNTPQILLLLLCLFIFPLAQAAQPAADEPDPELLLLMLGYMASDYGAAVNDNGQIINEFEYKEMLTFGGEVKSSLANLGPEHSTLAQGGIKLVSAIEGKAKPEQVRTLCVGLADLLKNSFNLARYPATVPDFVSAEKIYIEQCASCHGLTGLGDGEKGTELEPAPRNFTEDMQFRSPSQLFQIVKMGVPDTGMASFSHLTDDEIWSLSFFVLTYSHKSPQTGTVSEGEEASSLDLALSIHDLSQLSDEALIQAMVDRGTPKDQIGGLQDQLRHNPQALPLTIEVERDPLLVALDFLHQAKKSQVVGDHEKAARLVMHSYLEGFEMAEGALMARPGTSVPQLEARYADLQMDLSLNKENSGPDLELLIQDMQAIAVPATGGAGWAFAQSFVILFREGLEAILLVMLLLGACKAGKVAQASRAALLGAGAAIIAGIGLWISSRYLVASFSINPLYVELVSIWLAVLVLGYLVLVQGVKGDKALIAIKNSISKSAAKGALWSVGLLSFLAVFREALEVVIFYSSMWSQAADHHLQIVFGLVAGVAVLSLLFLVVLFLEARLPVRQLFMITSWGLFLVLLVVIGQGVNKLQQAGWLKVDAFAGLPHMPALGLFPTLQTLLPQVAVVLAFVGLMWWHKRTPKPAQ